MKMSEFGGGSNETIISAESGIGELSSRINALSKSINPSLLSHRSFGSNGRVDCPLVSEAAVSLNARPL